MLDTPTLLAQFTTGRKDFTGVKLHSGNLVGANLHGIILKNADLSFTNFEGADLTGADLSGSILTRSNFHNAILREAKFVGADLTYANIRNTFLQGASLRNANLMWAHLCGNDLMNADLTNTKLDWSCLLETQLTQAQLSLVPKGAIVSLQPNQRHDTYGYSLPAPVSDFYKTHTPSERLMASRYTMPKPLEQGKDKKMYC